MSNASLISVLESIDKPKLPLVQSGKSITIKDFWNEFIEPLLPDTQVVLQWHKVLMEYVKQPDAMFVIRGFSSAPNENIRRGWLTHINNTDLSFFYTDNFHAAYYFKMVKDGYVPLLEDLIYTYNSRKFPSRFGQNTSEEREKRAIMDGKNPGISTSGYKLSHIIDVGRNYFVAGTRMNMAEILKNYFPKGERDDWHQRQDSNGVFFVRDFDVADLDLCKEILTAMFLRFVHPFNYFLSPKKTNQTNTTDYADIGEYPRLIEYVKEKFRYIYGDAYQEFLDLIMLPDDIINVEYGCHLNKAESAPVTDVVQPDVCVKEAPKQNVNNFTNSSEMKVGQFVRAKVIPLLQSGKIPPEEIQNLQSIEYSQTVLDTRSNEFAVLSPFPMTDKKGYHRNYKNPIYIDGKRFYVSAQWYEGNYNALRAWYIKFS